MTDRVLVTGGAGYIGSHVVRQLGEAGYDVVVFDNLSTGHEWAVTHGKLVVGDLADPEALEALFAANEFAAVLHFAAHIIVPESVSDPLKYYRNNTRNTLNLLGAMSRHGVNRIVFSSTAAVYGMPDQQVLTEDLPLAPINPYGASKMMSERMIMDLASASDLDYVILRYFNVAGCDSAGRIGQDTPEATHLVKVACQHATGQKPHLNIFGTDYPTPDGTCIRDYIHVEDLAAAHLNALAYLREGSESLIANCGYGHGYSVRELLETVQRVSGRRLDVREGARRPGDMAMVVAANELIRHRLGWIPKRDDIELIVRSALNWEKKAHAKMPATGISVMDRLQ